MNKLIHILKILFLTIFVVFVFLWTMPKTSLYYKLEEVLAKHELIIHSEDVQVNLFGLLIKDGTINYKGIDGGLFRDIRLDMRFYETKVSLNKLTTNSTLQNIIPGNVDFIDIEHSIFNPLKIFVKGKLSLGDISGHIDIVRNNIYIVLEPTKTLTTAQRNVISFMKYETLPNSTKGVYVYEHQY